ncbi:dehydrogenase/reductase SDR family protein 7-like protein, partial [Leptotrombidium deliense]
VIKGSTSGIGEQIALDFAKNGAKVVVNGRNTTRLNAVVTKCNEVSPTKQNVSLK